MKQIIEVKINARKVPVEEYKTDLLAVGMYCDVKKPEGLCAELDARLGGAIGKVLKLGDFKGKEGTTRIIYGNGKIGAERVIFVGLGEKKKATLDTARKAASLAAFNAVEIEVKNLGLAMHQAFEGQFDTAEMGRAIAEGAYFGSYRYDEYITKEENGRAKSLNVEVVDSDTRRITGLKKGFSAGVVVGEAQSYARTLANRPGNVINPAALAEEAKKLARGLAGVSCTIFDEKQLAAKKMGGILAVGSGSRNKPRLIVLRYKPAGEISAKAPIVGLVGKAITFDSGGISIKPPQNMEQMKLDKSGGIAVLVAIKAAAELKLPINVWGFVPSAENLPSGSSYRPGDIVTTYSGKTIEVQNTDAEGRMILSDALAYAAEQKCDPIIDIATLTGACMVALGKYMAGLMGNDEKLMQQIQQAAKESGEKVWPMPSGEEYLAEMKSKIADLKNVGSKWGGACTGAAFLSQFVRDAKWVHLDIAGVDFFENGKSVAEGSSGFGVRLLITFLMNLAGRKN